MRATPNDVLELSSGILGSNSSSLLPHAVTKESLQYARVLQQVDKKFIAVVAQNVLLLVDQVSVFCITLALCNTSLAHNTYILWIPLRCYNFVMNPTQFLAPTLT
jgi:DNA mismatch repair ATPase MutL